MIRHAENGDISRIAEMIVYNYRINFYPFFQNDPFYFGELNVLDIAAEFAPGTQRFLESYVYDDGVVKGFVQVGDGEIKKLYVEPSFQSQGIGAALLQFAVNECGGKWLWVLAHNARGKAFYERNGFILTGEEIIEDEFVPLQKMKIRRSL